MIVYLVIVPIIALVPNSAGMRGGGGQEAKVAADRISGGGAGEELGILVRVEVHEKAGEREREKVGAHEAVGVDHFAPGPADAVGGSDLARRDAAEDVGEHVFRQVRRQPLLPLSSTRAAFSGRSSSAAMACLPYVLILDLEETVSRSLARFLSFSLALMNKGRHSRFCAANALLLFSLSRSLIRLDRNGVGRCARHYPHRTNVPSQARGRGVLTVATS